MRGKIAKKLRKFAKQDMMDCPFVSYSTIVTGQEYKRTLGIELNKTVVLSVDCQKREYKLLKRIWKDYR